MVTKWEAIPPAQLQCSLNSVSEPYTSLPYHDDVCGLIMLYIINYGVTDFVNTMSLLACDYSIN